MYYYILRLPLTVFHIIIVYVNILCILCKHKASLNEFIIVTIPLLLTIN